ncbi:MAG: hypothetical protein RI897_784 [Verrucomicrobiota bacterium]
MDGSLAFCPDLAAVVLDDFAADGESEAVGAALVAGGVAGMEGVEDGFEFGGVESAAVVGKAEEELVVVGGSCDGDVALWCGVAEGVIEEFDDGFLEPGWIGEDADMFGDGDGGV